MADYMIKPNRVGGVAVEKPNLFIRLIRAVFPMKGDSKGEVLRKLFFIVALIAFLITGGLLLKDVFVDYMNKLADDKLSGMYVDTGEDADPETGILPDMAELLKINPDIVGWMNIKNTVINYPVMQTKDSNEFYLTHNFQREESRAGSLVADYRNVFSPNGQSANTIIYGHNMYVGTQFHQLVEYYTSIADDSRELDFYKEHPTITFNTLYERAEWKICSVILFNVEEKYGEVYDYISKREFANKDQFNQFVIDMMDRSMLWNDDIDYKYGDEFITLSTCTWPYRADMDNVRLVIVARKVRDGESATVDTSKAVRNYSPLCWQWQYDLMGGYWAGSTWDRRLLLDYTADDAARDGYTFKED